MYCQVLLKVLSISKLGKVLSISIIGNQRLGRMQICGGGMLDHASIKVTLGFKLSLKPLIVPNSLRMGSEISVNYELTLVRGNKV